MQFEDKSQKRKALRAIYLSLHDFNKAVDYLAPLPTLFEDIRRNFVHIFTPTYKLDPALPFPFRQQNRNETSLWVGVIK
jgi:hypothetical protein